MLLLTLLLQALALAYAFVLPGVLIGMAAGRAWSLAMRLGAGFTLGVLVVPIASFSAAWLLGVSVRPGLVIAVATGINLLGAVGWWLQRRAAPATRAS